MSCFRKWYQTVIVHTSQKLGEKMHKTMNCSVFSPSAVTTGKHVYISPLSITDVISSLEEHMKKKPISPSRMVLWLHNLFDIKSALQWRVLPSVYPQGKTNQNFTVHVLPLKNAKTSALLHESFTPLRTSVSWWDSEYKPATSRHQLQPGATSCFAFFLPAAVRTPEALKALVLYMTWGESESLAEKKMAS